MKTIIKVLGIVVLVTTIGIPIFAQAPVPNESIREITAQPNVVSSLLHRSFVPGEKHFYRVNNLTDSVYYILWRDEDNPANLSTPIGDIKVSIINLSTNMVIVTGVDVNRSLNTDNELNSILIRSGTHYSPGNDILIIVEGVINSDSGNYAIMVF